MNDDLSLAEVERRLKSGDWYYDWLLRRWVDRRDGKLAIALDTMRDLTRKVKALDDAAWLAEVEAATADACAAGIDPAAYAQRLRDERKAERVRDQTWWAQHPPTLSPDMQRKHAPLTITESKAAANESIFAGYLAVFGNRDAHDDIIAPGACDATLAALNAAPYSERFLLPLLFAHDHAKPLGGFTTLDANSRGLAFTAAINTDTQLGRETASLVKSGGLRGMSIGYVAEKTHMERGGVRVIERLRLVEGSVVALASNPLAKVYQPPV